MIDRTKLLHLALVLALPALWTCEGGLSSGPPGSVSGRILVEGTPVAGVTVELDGPTTGTTTTNGSGEFLFSPARPGGYTVRISGWPTELHFPYSSKDVFVGEEDDEVVEFEGTFVRTANIRGTVEIDGSDEEEVTVVLDGPDERETVPGPDGTFSFDRIRPGEYVVRVTSASGNVSWVSSSQLVSVSLGQTRTVSFSGEFLIAATVEILRLERPGSIIRIDPSRLSGEADVMVRIDPGSETVSQIRAVIGGSLLGTHDPGPDGLDEDQEIEIRINTASFDPETGEPLLQNGSATLMVVADTEERGQGASSAALDVTLENEDRIAPIVGPPDEDGVVRNGVRWFGNQDLDFELFPVLHSDVEVSSITVRATGDPSPNGGASLDIGSGPGQPHEVEGPPFVFTASLEDNGGLVEDDDDGDGHTIEIVEVRDGEGQDITSEFVPEHATPLEGLYVDFVAPVVSSPGADGDVRIGGASPDGTNHFSAGSFTLFGVSDGGAGASQLVTWDVTASNVQYTSVSRVSDLGERSAPGYRLVVREISDAVGNAVDLDAQPVAGGDSRSAGFGVDRSGPRMTGLWPDPNGPLTVFNQTSAAVRFTVNDAVLASGGAGAGVDPADVSGSATGSGWSFVKTAPNYTVDLTGVAEGTYDVVARASDLASPPNSAEVNWTVAVDGTAPVLNLTEVPSDVQDTGTSTNIQLELGGTMTDNFQVSSTQSRVEVRYDSDGTPAASASCGAYGSGGLYTAPAEIDKNSVPIGSPFQVEFRAENPNPGGATTTYRYCVWAIAADAAVDNTLNPAPNVTRSYVQVDITWNP